jgi:hypothetical protein
LEFLRDVVLATLHVAPLDRRRRTALASFAPLSAVKDHVPALVGEYVLKIQVSFCCTRHDEKKLRHNPLLLESGFGTALTHAHHVTRG